MVEAVTFQVRGLKEVNRFLINLPKNMANEIEIGGETFMRNVQKSAKLRAPRWSGKLAQSISFKKIKGSIILTVDSPYGYFQEFGYKPHFVRASRSTRSGFKVRDWMNDKGATGSGIFVKKFKPFITPALEINIAKLDILLNNHANKALRMS